MSILFWWYVSLYIFIGCLFGRYKDRTSDTIFWSIVLGRFLGGCFILVLKQRDR